MRSLFLSYFVYIRYTAIFYFGKLTESNNLFLLKCILYYTINVVVNLLRREKGMESIIIKPERVFQEGYRYYISYITHPVKWKSALRKWYFIKYVRDLDLFSFERQHYPYNLVFVCCNPPDLQSGQYNTLPSLLPPLPERITVPGIHSKAPSYTPAGWQASGQVSFSYAFFTSPPYCAQPPLK